MNKSIRTWRKLLPRKAATHDPSDFLSIYQEAPAGSPDKFVTTGPVTFTWHTPPKKYRRIPLGRFAFLSPFAEEAVIFSHRISKDRHYFELYIPAPFYFSVSAAPDFPSAEPGACLHDMLYAESEQLADLLSLTVKEVLGFANSWFKVQLNASEFPLANLYYAAVRHFGYVFHVIAGWFGNLGAWFDK